MSATVLPALMRAQVCEDVTEDYLEGIYWRQRLKLDETDLGNAHRLVLDHQGDLHYVPGLGWLAWEGDRWKRDDTGSARRAAKATVKRIAEEAIRLRDQLEQVPDDGPDRKQAEKRAAQRFAWSLKSQDKNRLAAVLTVAESEEDIVVRADELDADPMLLNVANGTIDLRTGELLPHDPAGLHTRLAPVDYRPNATSARWREFLHTATGGDLELSAYLQRAVGYTLTGDTGAECLFFAHGPGATGKTTFIESLKGILGDYAATAAFHTLTTQRDRGPSGDLARLAHTRLVACSEVGRGAAFNPETIKTLTGGDRIVAAFKYRDEFEYRPNFKLWLAANDTPAVDFDDDAMRRRIRLLPFAVVIPEERRDPTLKRDLTTDPNELAAVLAWAVEGCLAWQREGLGEPAQVRDATDQYFAAQDPVADWIADCCHLDPDARATRPAARASYEIWCKNQGHEPIPPQAFASALRVHGVNDAKSNGQRQWRGLSIHRVTGTPRDTTNGKSSHTRPREDAFTEPVTLGDPVSLPGATGDPR